jgi:Uncharacterized protein conserved in bacteria (DUF2188)
MLCPIALLPPIELRVPYPEQTARFPVPYRDLRKALDTGKRPTDLMKYRVSWREGSWIVEDIDKEEVLSAFSTKKPAVAKAKSLADRQDVSKLEILRRDGTVEDVYTCGQQPRSLFDLDY